MGTGQEKTGQSLEVLLCDDPGFLLGHVCLCQLGSQFESFSRTVSLLGGRGLPGEVDELGEVLCQVLPGPLQGLCALVPLPQSTETPGVQATFSWSPATLSSPKLKLLLACTSAWYPRQGISLWAGRAQMQGASVCPALHLRIFRSAW